MPRKARAGLPILSKTGLEHGLPSNLLVHGEKINNPNFKVVEFDHFKTQAGLPSFVLSVSEWIEKTNAIGFVVKKGKYGEVRTLILKGTSGIMQALMS